LCCVVSYRIVSYRVLPMIEYLLYCIFCDSLGFYFTLLFNLIVDQRSVLSVTYDY
jgi:hypothetical protein